MANQFFCLDHPSNHDQVSRTFRCSGWYLQLENDLGVAVDGLPSFALCRSPRPDLRKPFPNQPRAEACGFYGDVIVMEPSNRWKTITIIERIGGQWVPIHEFQITGDTCQSYETHRKRDFCIEDLICQPGGSRIPNTCYFGEGRHNAVQLPTSETYSILGTRHFHCHGSLPLIRLNESEHTHPYGTRATELIRSSTGLVLDIGAGITNPINIPPHVVLMDAVHYANLDLVSTCAELPFLDSSFETVISQAVFEHVADPFLLAKEIFRVLKPGGIFYLTTAFMQPLHGDPFHYFNMTANGLKRVLSGFEIKEIGIEPFQAPSYGFQMQIEAVLPYLNGEMESIFKETLKFIINQRAQIDNDLGEIGREVLAAGFFSVARKPRN